MSQQQPWVYMVSPKPYFSRDEIRRLSKELVENDDFKIWGQPIILGPTAFHIYGADRKSWTPINLEVRSKKIVLLYPHRDSMDAAEHADWLTGMIGLWRIGVLK